MQTAIRVQPKVQSGGKIEIKDAQLPVFNRVTFDPEILGGKPHIRGTRLSVEFILELFASGGTREDILEAYPQLTQEDIQEVLQYAARAVKNEIFLTAEIGA